MPARYRTANQLPPISFLRQVLRYCPETGSLFWRDDVPPTPRGVPRANKAAGRHNAKGYLVISVGGTLLVAHRIAFALHYGVWPDQELDHINGKRDDNRIANLRQCDRYGNNHNTARPASNKSGFKGVCWCARYGKWEAKIKARGRQHWLGLFETPEAAHAAYASAALRLHGEFARP